MTDKQEPKEQAPRDNKCLVRSPWAANPLMGALVRIGAWAKRIAMVCGLGGPNRTHPVDAEDRDSYADPMRLEEMTPHLASVDRRIEMTTRCRDMDDVRKVPGAGKVEILPEGMHVQIMHNGLRVLVDGYYGAWMSRLIELCHGCHEPQEERVFYEVMRRLPAKATMIELGGYWAFYSLWFLSRGKHRRSIVVEPDPKHLEVGQNNARINGLAPTFLHGALASAAGPPVPFRTEESGEVLLPRFSVPFLMDRYAIETLHVLHCDAQGAELEMLYSCEGLFKSKRVQFVFVSTHDFRISGDPLTHQRCLAVVRNSGGQVIAEHDVHESYSGDGLIVAYFGDDSRAREPIPVSRNRYSESLFRNPLYDLATVRKTGAYGNENDKLPPLS